MRRENFFMTKYQNEKQVYIRILLQRQFGQVLIDPFDTAQQEDKHSYPESNCSS